MDLYHPIRRNREFSGCVHAPVWELCNDLKKEENKQGNKCRLVALDLNIMHLFKHFDRFQLTGRIHSFKY